MAAHTMTMKSAVVGTSSLLRRSPTQPSKPAAAVPRGRGRVVVAAHQGPSELPMKLFGALAAAQLFVLPLAGPAVAADFVEEVKEEITSPAARDAANKTLDSVPTVTEVGENLSKEFSQSSATEVGDKVKAAAKDVTNQVGDATPSSGDLKGAAADLKNKISLDFGEVVAKITGSGDGNVYDAAREASKEATNPAETNADNPGKAVGNTDPTPDPEEAKDDVNKLANKVGESEAK